MMYVHTTINATKSLSSFQCDLDDVHTTKDTINVTKSLSSFQCEYYNAYLGSRETPQTHAHIKGKYIHTVHPILSFPPHTSPYTPDS